MKRFVAGLLLSIAGAAGAAPAPPPDAHAAEFKAFFAKFQSAAKANDRQAIADLIAFPVSDWSVERKGDVQTEAIADRAAFLKRYDLLFNASMRSHAASGKPEALKDGRYMELWHDANTELSFEFGYDAKAGYRVTSFSIGPL